MLTGLFCCETANYQGRAQISYDTYKPFKNSSGSKAKGCCQNRAVWSNGSSIRWCAWRKNETWGQRQCFREYGHQIWWWENQHMAYGFKKVLWRLKFFCIRLIVELIYENHMLETRDLICFLCNIDIFLRKLVKYP